MKEYDHVLGMRSINIWWKSRLKRRKPE